MSTIQSASPVSFQGRMLDAGSVVRPTRGAVRYTKELGQGAVDGLTKFINTNTIIKDISPKGGFWKKLYQQFTDPVHAATKAHVVKVVKGSNNKQNFVVVAGDNRSGAFFRSKPIVVQLSSPATEQSVFKQLQLALAEGLKDVKIKTTAAEIKHPVLRVVG